MTNERSPEIPEKAALPREITPEDRARLSGPVLRTFHAIADAWEMDARELLALLGRPDRSTHEEWARAARAQAPLSLPLDTLTRISAVIAIEQALANLFEDRAQAMTWMRGAHDAPAFAGASPMETILSGGHDALEILRRYLDTWQTGQLGRDAPEGSFVPVTEEDLVFV
ncbi:antitoxin Xre/MbcA/ParS toxin-binding domain-containing protein [Jannaschia formosa]|uniref:antitoxin Xre/MbcA/ParS toxin-binding domain-containing protein n=1 Tax=Jannaschia formosa TaxID=2259592 RepID=UPI0014315952|nr:antitoxin Xre/MbcA/ParS toxin-binding domain-containing protein [Jannaschia formosa]